MIVSGLKIIVCKTFKAKNIPRIPSCYRQKSLVIAKLHKFWQTQKSTCMYTETRCGSFNSLKIKLSFIVFLLRTFGAPYIFVVVKEKSYKMTKLKWNLSTNLNLLS